MTCHPAETDLLDSGLNGVGGIVGAYITPTFLGSPSHYTRRMAIVQKIAVRVPRYRQVAAYCHQFAEVNGCAPSYGNIVAALRITDRGTVRRYVKQAEAAGLLYLGSFSGGRGHTQPRIRLGTPGEADPQRIKMGRDL